MDPVIIGQIFGILTTLCAIISTQMPKRWQMMLGTMVVNILSALNVLFVGAGLTVCMANIVASVHAPINAYRAKKSSILLLPKRSFSAFFILWLGELDSIFPSRREQPRGLILCLLQRQPFSLPRCSCRGKEIYGFVCSETLQFIQFITRSSKTPEYLRIYSASSPS